MIPHPSPPTHEFHSFPKLMRKLGETFVVGDVMVHRAQIEYVAPGDGNAASRIVAEKKYSVVPASADGQNFEAVFCTEHPVNGARTITTMRETSVSDHIPDSTPLAEAFYLFANREWYLTLRGNRVSGLITYWAFNSREFRVQLYAGLSRVEELSRNLLAKDGCGLSSDKGLNLSPEVLEKVRKRFDSVRQKMGGNRFVDELDFHHGHAISLASSGDSIMVAAATYTENLTISLSLKIVGSGAKTTIIDGGGKDTVVTISNANAHVALSKVTIRNGLAPIGGGINNSGTLTIHKSILSANNAFAQKCPAGGGGVANSGTLMINNSTLIGNSTSCPVSRFASAHGGGIDNGGELTINNTTLSGNRARGFGFGGGISNNTAGTLTINNSTLSANGAGAGGGIVNYAVGRVTINNSTLSGNSAAAIGGGILDSGAATATLQNSIVANSPHGGNCYGTITSNGYNLSSDNTCNFNNSGDLNNTDPKLGPLQNNGGPTQTQALLHGSPAIDAGNPAGCTDGRGHLLKTDQRGMPRPDPEDSGGCDMGAFESQSDLTCTPLGGVCGPGLPPCCPASFPHHSFCSSQHGFGRCLESSLEKRGLGISLDH